MLKSLLRLRSTRVRDAMTPRTVVFSVAEDMSVGEFGEQHENVGFSRIPIYAGDRDDISGFVLRGDLLLAFARGDTDSAVSKWRRDISTVAENIRLSRALREFRAARSHIMLVVNEYGEFEGILTLEDLLETLLGLEIVDEADTKRDMQEFARSQWEERAKRMGLSIKDNCQPSGMTHPSCSSRLLPDTDKSISVRSQSGMPSSMTR